MKTEATAVADQTTITGAQAARTLRTALKDVYPGVEFSVRGASESNGQTVRVMWQDGPSIDEFAQTTERAIPTYDVRHWNQQTDGVNGPRIPGHVIVWSRQYSATFLTPLVEVLAAEWDCAAPPVVTYHRGYSDQDAWVDLTAGWAIRRDGVAFTQELVRRARATSGLKERMR